VKLVGWDTVLDRDFSAGGAFGVVRTHITEAIERIKWPPDSDTFAIYPESGKKRGEGNGVLPIKNAFVRHLVECGWVREVGRFDAHYTFPRGIARPFVVEWETGNISSSHRSVNRMALGMLKGEISGGVLVVSSEELRPFLTDRIGNATELIPYHPLWRLWSQNPGFEYLAIVTVEHDLVSRSVPRIPKMTDGRALG